MKKFGCLIIMLVVALQFSFAIEVKAPNPLTVKAATDLAIQNSPEIRLANDQMLTATRRVKQAQTKATSTDLSDWNGEVERLTKAKDVYLNPLIVKQSVAMLERVISDQKSELTKSVKRQFYTIQSLELQKKAAEENLRSSLSDLAVNKNKFKLGTVTANDVTDRENIVAKNQIAILKTTNAIKNAQVALNDLLGLPLLTNQVLQYEKLEPVNLPQLDYEKSVASQLLKSSVFIKLKEDIAIKEKEQWVLLGYNVTYEVSDDEALDGLRDDIVLLKDKQLREENRIRVKFTTDLNLLKNLNDDLRIAKLNYDYQVKLQKASETKYTLGLVDSVSLDQIKSQTMLMLSNYNSSLIDYLLAYGTFTDTFNESAIK